MKFILPVPRIFGHYIFQNFNNCGKNEVPVPATVRAPYMQLTENPFRNLEIPHLQNLAGTIDPDIGNSIMGVPQPPYPYERDAASFIHYKIKRKTTVCMDKQDRAPAKSRLPFCLIDCNK
jgi:hypothetical protein